MAFILILIKKYFYIMKKHNVKFVGEVTMDALESLFSGALYASSYFSASYNSEVYNKLPGVENDCLLETCLARMLANGKAVTICDHYAEDETEAYGNVPHEWDNAQSCMRYKITYEHVIRGITAALNDVSKYVRDAAWALVNDEWQNLNVSEDDVLLQFIVFGDWIYG